MNNDDYVPADETVGKELRDAYRQLAVERTPLRLDNAVLAEARQATKPAGGRLWSWRRPFAWATMITLSFVIVLESARETPDADFVPTESPREAPAPASIARPPGEADGRGRDDQASEAAALKTEIEKRARDRELDAMSAPVSSSFSGTPRRAAETAARSLAEPVAEADAATVDEARQVQDTPGDPPDNAISVQQGIAASAEGKRAGTDSLGTALFLAAPGAEVSCEEAARSDPDLWRHCIDDLFAAERRAEALVELELYRTAFPDQPLPELAK